MGSESGVDLRSGYTERADAQIVRNDGVGAKLKITSMDDPAVYPEQGQQQLERGQYLQARQMFQVYTERYRYDSAGWYGLGMASFYLQDFAGAIATLTTTLTIAPHHTLALARRGMAYRITGQLALARDDFEQARLLVPQTPQDWQGHGLACQQLRYFDAAIASYDQALTLDPDDHWAWAHRGNTLDDLGHYPAALVSYDRALALETDLYDVWTNRGVVLAHLGRFEAAIASYDQALVRQPRGHQALYNRGNALLQLGRPQDAMAHYTQALDLTDQQFGPAWSALGLAHQQTQGHAAARATWDTGITALSPNLPLYGYRCGQLYACQANQAYSVGLFPQDRAALTIAQTRYQQALDHLPLDTFPQEHLHLWQSLLRVYYQLGHVDTFAERLLQGKQKLAQVLRHAPLSPPQQQHLIHQCQPLYQLHVEALITAHPVTALEWTEAIVHHQSQIPASAEPELTPQLTYAEMQALLSSGTALIYWHYSPVALTTFILKANQPLTVLPQPAEASGTGGGCRADPDRTQQHQALTTWLHRWHHQRPITRHGPEGCKLHPGYDALEGMLFDQLHTILDIASLSRRYLRDVEHLILIPTDALQTIPLHLLFPQRLSITYLPSLGAAANQTWSPRGTVQRLLTLAPAATDSDAAEQPIPQSSADVEVGVIAQLYKSWGSIQLRGAMVTQARAIAALKLATHQIHWLGALSSIRRTEPALPLTQGESLVYPELFRLDLQHYHLVCLSDASEAQDPGGPMPDAVALAAGLLRAGVHAVVYPLWSTDPQARTLLMIRLHQLLQQPQMVPPVALRAAQDWLRTLTYGQLMVWYETLTTQLQSPAWTTVLQQQAVDLNPDANPTDLPYRHPYYWAGYQCMGLSH